MVLTRAKMRRTYCALVILPLFLAELAKLTMPSLFDEIVRFLQKERLEVTDEKVRLNV